MFTKEEQASNCEQLAAKLEALPNDGGYDHGVFFESNVCGTRACALGWAGYHHIGGMHLNPGGLPVHPDMQHKYRPSVSADYVFGTGAWDSIFNDTALDELIIDRLPPNDTWKLDDSDCASDVRVGTPAKNSAIEALREQAHKLRSE